MSAFHAKEPFAAEGDIASPNVRSPPKANVRPCLGHLAKSAIVCPEPNLRASNVTFRSFITWQLRQWRGCTGVPRLPRNTGSAGGKEPARGSQSRLHNAGRRLSALVRG